MSQQMPPQHWALLLLTAGLFGSSFYFITLAVDTIPPMTIAAGRSLIAAFLVLLFIKKMNVKLPPLGTAWGPLIGLGVMTASIPYFAIAYSQQHISSSLGGILFSTIPIFSVLIAPLLLSDEFFSRSKLVGVIIGFVGVVLIIGPNAIANLDTQLMGILITLGAAFSYALGNIYARTLKQHPPTALAAGQLLTGSLILIPLSLIVDSPWTLTPSTSSWASLLVVAVFSTALPVILMFWLVKTIGATNTSLLAFFMPIAAVGMGMLFLNEQVDLFSFLGLLLILLGAAIVTNLRFFQQQTANLPNHKTRAPRVSKP